MPFVASIGHCFRISWNWPENMLGMFVLYDLSDVNTFLEIMYLGSFEEK